MAGAPAWLRWLALLRAGVALRIPPRSIPYQDTHRATLVWLGADAFERADEWTAFEAGHGQYGGTDRLALTLEETKALLGSLAPGWVEPVLPRSRAGEGPSGRPRDRSWTGTSSGPTQTIALHRR